MEEGPKQHKQNALAATLTSADGTFAATLTSRDGAETASPAGQGCDDAIIGSTLDHFDVGELLGTGGMGAVYLGHDMSLDRAVALKVLHDDRTGDELHRERFLREARVQASLSHPNVVQIYYIGRRDPADDSDQGALFFAMEFVEGDSLEDVIDAEEVLEPERARATMVEVVQGLRAGHEAGIIHRDVKPGNILRGVDGRVRIADFGLAKPMDAKAITAELSHLTASRTRSRARTASGKQKQLTHEGALLGSPWYIAPEQAQGKSVDHRADMYALGATFYHLLTGQPVFDGDTALGVAAAHCNQVPIPVAQRALASRQVVVPPQLAAIVDRLLAKAPDDRFATYDELLAALEQAAPKTREYAGFWTRGASLLIDGALATTLIYLLGWFGAVVHLAHVTVGHAWRGQTLGKYLQRIEVKRLDGDLQPLGLARSAARTLVGLWLPFVAAVILAVTGGLSQLKATISGMAPEHLGELQEHVGELHDTVVLVGSTAGGFLTLLYLGGLALASISPRKRALHDMVVRSVVHYRL